MQLYANPQNDPALGHASDTDQKVNIAVTVLRRERDQAKEQMAALKLRVRELEGAIALIEGNGAGAALKSPGDGDLKDRVLELIAASGSEGATPRAIAAKLTASGRSTSDASVSSTLSRLKSDGKVHNERGLWFATSADPAPSDGMVDPLDDIEEECPFEDDMDDTDDVPF